MKCIPACLAVDCNFTRSCVASYYLEVSNNITKFFCLSFYKWKSLRFIYLHVLCMQLCWPASPYINLHTWLLMVHIMPHLSQEMSWLQLICILNLNLKEIEPHASMFMVVSFGSVYRFIRSRGLRQHIICYCFHRKSCQILIGTNIYT